MTAYDILRRNKTSIVDTLGADHTLILNKAKQNKLITQHDHKTLRTEQNVEALVDKIMKKGEENCQLFLNLLQTDEIQETYPELKNILEDELYELKSQPTGLCLIINNEMFPGVGKKKKNVRYGTDKDAESLGKVFTWLGFRVLMCKDQTKDQMERALKCFASQRGLSQLQEFKVQEWTGSGFTDLLEAPQHGDAFICCLLSHGNKGVVLGTDWKPLPIKQITRTFMATPESPLTAKPKVFLIQACQGGQVHPMVESKDQAGGSCSTQQADSSDSTSIPQEADFLVHCSTVEDYKSLRNPTEGSWFIQSVCEQLEEGCQRNEEIEVILRRVNKEVARKDSDVRCGPECGLRYCLKCGTSCGPTKQMPAIWHTLRKRLVLTPRN
ncbi:caspase-8-like [Trematomus bernacchii]|uniref:caspase-8-like n=1 Tax=Trematomus bernacchii TaxID=40690 RepID=UPI00146C56DE|nr:caspase-8-like [Trematomus bernacchii]